MKSSAVTFVHEKGSFIYGTNTLIDSPHVLT